MADPGKVSDAVRGDSRVRSNRTYHLLKKEDVDSDHDMVLSLTSTGGVIQTVRLCVLEPTKE